MTGTTFTIVAHPNGRRVIVGTVHGSVEGAIASAKPQAKLRQEYVDVHVTETDERVAIVGPDGEVI